MKHFSIFVITLVIFLFSANAAFAEDYGGDEPSPEILIDKMVSVPHTTKGGGTDYSYVDNLSTSDHRYGPQDYVYFKLRVKNTSDKTLNNVIVRDFAPDYVNLFENPGYFDGNDIKIEAGTFTPNQEKEYIIKGRIKHQNDLPSDKALFCVFNTARATNSEVFDEDSSQFCIEKEVGTVPEVPEAGAAHGVLVMALAGISALGGLKLRKIGA